jgi:hypothetical protein
MFSTMPRIGTFTFLEHLQALARIQQGNILRRSDDHRAGHRHFLRQESWISPVPGGISTIK